MKNPPRRKPVAATTLSASHEDVLFARVIHVIEAARSDVTPSGNAAIVALGRAASRAGKRSALPGESHGGIRTAALTESADDQGSAA